MKNTVFNENVYIEYPDDFHEMSNEELQKYFAGNLLRFGAMNAEKHVILSVGKTQSKFVNVFTNTQSVLLGAENTLKKNLKDYTRIDEFDAEILNESAKGIHFKYVAVNKNVKQFCEMAVVKSKRCFYVLYCISRLSDVGESLTLFKEFRDSLKFVPINS